MTQRRQRPREAPLPPHQDGPDFDWSWAEDDAGWVPPAVDTTRPSAARMYDYALGGKDNFEVDRRAAEQALRVMPDGPTLARANRDFLIRAVELISEAGIHQFLDLGTGIPTVPSVHEVARRTDPDARAVYVDNDPIVLAHSRAAVDGDPGLVALPHDLREPFKVLGDRRLQAIIDTDRPYGLLMVAVLHFVDLAIAPEVVSHYLSALPSGSHVAFSIGTRDDVRPEVVAEVERVYATSQSPIVLRTRAQIEQLVDGLDLLEPGLTEVTRWRADGTPGAMRMLAGIGVKP
jgi:hypothetical protein